jgi:ATP-dependent RNA helicase SUPV3L1/SUV3
MATLSERFSADGRARVRAVLGPTNTGKTHLALERMLLHRTGMIGLPLRLLAREVYDRLVARAGADAVALLTGEEKIRPKDARYFVCTVESMPLDRPFHFVAVDEIQLAAHRTRGHVFTDRLLHARGVDETLFLGSATIEPVLTRLLPGIDVGSQPRLSALRYAGHHKLHRVPKRSAVVAFSAADVYEHAERIRARLGGCAVVLGALSPRARNAQVALYQDGAVDHVVATDAIGMGLNMDVAHVAFSAIRKFDGRDARALTDDELAQIAGRAGRYRQDGTFGTTGACDPLPDETVASIEEHRFAPIEWIWWRNPDLDFSSPEALRDALERPPPHRALRRMPDAEDHRALLALLDAPEVAARLSGPKDLRLLWQVAQVPDYRKTLTGHHAELLAALFVALHEHGELPAAFLEERLGRLDRDDGDLDALMSRIAFVRTWTFVSYRADWLADAVGLQERARAIEDRLSDALHERLTSRFVDHAIAVQVAVPLPPTAVDEDGTLRVGGEIKARIEGLRLVDPRFAPGSPTEAAVRHRAGIALAERVRALAADPDDAFAIDAAGKVAWRGAPIASLQSGPSLVQPRVRVRHLPDLDPLANAVIADRVERLVAARIDALVGSLWRRVGRELPPEGLDVLLAVEQGLGAALVAPLERALDALAPEDHKRLAKLDLRVGKRVVYLPAALRPPARATRALLWRVRHGSSFPIPADNATSVPAEGPDAYYLALGFPVVGGVAVRADALERTFALARKLAADGPFALPPEVPSWLGSDRDRAGQVLDGLGFERVRLGVEDRFVPPPRPAPRRPSFPARRR